MLVYLAPMAQHDSSDVIGYQVEDPESKENDLFTRMDNYRSQARSPLSQELDGIFADYFAIKNAANIHIEFIPHPYPAFLVSKCNGAQLLFQFNPDTQEIVRDYGQYYDHVGYSKCKFGYCHHSRTHYIDLIVNGAYLLRFGFAEAINSFSPYHCSSCPTTTEDHLHPQYVEFVNGKAIFHMKNSALSIFEQYARGPGISFKFTYRNTPSMFKKFKGILYFTPSQSPWPMRR